MADWPHGEGEMARRVRGHDWAATPLGAIETWPERLRGVVDLVLASPIVATVAVGDARLLLYNDAAARLYGDRHPAALGRPLAETFADTYPAVAAFYDRVFAGESVTVAAQPLAVGADGGREVFDAYLTPVREADGAVVGAHMTGFEIGERARAEIALTASEERYRAFVTASEDVVYRMSADWSEMRELDGRGFLADTREARRDWMEQYILPADRAAVRAAIDGAIRDRTMFALEHRVVRSDGTPGWTSSRAVPVLGPSGELVEWLGAASDVTARHEVEAALRESEAKYRTLFETMTEGYAVGELRRDASGKAVDWRFIEYNPALERHTGMDRAASLGRWFSEMFPGADRTYWLNVYQAVVDTQTARTFEDYWPPLDRWLGGEAYPAKEGRFYIMYRDVSQRKRSELALQESETRFRLLADNISQLAWTCDSLGAVNWYNRRWLDYTGLSFEDMKSWGWDKVQHPDHVERVVAGVARAAASGEPWEDTFPLRRHDGEYRWFYSQAMPIRDDRGAIVQWFGTNTDVTDQKRTAEELRKSEARLAAAFESVPVGVAVVDLSGAAVISNSRYRRFLPNGVVPSRDPVRGARWRAWDAAGKPLERHDFPTARAMRGDSVPGQDMLYTDEDDREIWTTVATVPTRDDHGRVSGLVTAIADVDVAKRNSAALRKSEAWLQTLMRGVPQLVWRAAGDGHWTWASPQWTEFTGQPEAASHDRGWLGPVHPDDREAVMAKWAEAVAHGEFEADYRLRQASDRRYRWFQTRATPARDAVGDVVEWLGTSTDVDDLRGMQDRQQLLLAELQHRVRNILTVVRSVFARTVEAEGPIEEVADHFRGRLDSLARTQVIVTRSVTGLVDLEDLIRDELLSVGAADGPEITIAGPDVALAPSAAESIGLAIHELTTNALKYGALKVKGATLAVEWLVNTGEGGAPRLDLTWSEQGVPAVSVKPARYGFGSELIEEALPYRLGAETSLTFRGGGVCCSISLPLPDQGASAAEPGKGFE